MNNKVIKEGAEKALAAEHGYDVYSGGKWYKTEKDAKNKRGGLTSNQLWNKFASSDDKAAGSNPTDKDARKPGEESTRSEEVEYDREELEESDRFRPSSPYNSKKQSRTSLSRGYNARGMENGLPGPDNSPYGRARMRAANLEGKTKIIKAKNRATNTMFAREFGEELFHKDTDRLLREHIRAEYEARGIYPTAKEVQETYNTVMDLIEKRKSYEQSQASLMLRQGASGKEVKDTIGAKRTPEGKSGNALLRKARSNADHQAMMQGHISDDNGEPLLDRIVAHKAKRGKPTKISPSSPARKQSRVEKDTRFLMGQGFSPDHLRRIMSDSGR
jgi:hypothetical protein